MGKEMTFNEVVVVYQQVLGTFFIAKKKPLTSEDIAKRNTPFQQKRTFMKQQMHWNHLVRKAQKEARQVKRQKKQSNIFCLQFIYKKCFTNVTKCLCCCHLMPR